MKKETVCSVCIGLVTGFLNGLFGAGGGCIVVPAAERLLKMDEKKSHATAVAVILMLSCVSSVFYLKNGFFDFGLWVPVTIGGVGGGLLGANLLEKIPKSLLKILFGGLIVVTAVKLIF